MSITEAGVIANVEKRYEGNLEKYFVVTLGSTNAKNPYHNMRHTLHVMMQCYDAAVFHGLEPRPFRNLLIMALFHDHNHPGLLIGTDNLWIEVAVAGLKANILPEDEPFFEEIERGIRTTQFPHVVHTVDLSPEEKMLRDADMSQGFASEWIQQILFGLSTEMRITPKEMLFMQEDFIINFKFATTWGEAKFGHAREQRLEEVRELVRTMS